MLDRLFRKANGDWVTSDDLKKALVSVSAQDCEVLYLHSGVSFGTPNPELNRGELLEIVYTTVQSLGVPTLCVPTYTFSFCNGEEYDRTHSRSRMGALNEFIRRRPEAIRSIDPLLSVAVVGTDRDLVENLGHESIGAGSTFDKLRHRRRVRFLFLGVRLGDCFTYMHHLEWVAKVPYRYNRRFSGYITDGSNRFQDEYTLFVRYHNVAPNLASYTYEHMLAKAGLLKIAPVGDNSIQSVEETPAREMYLELLRSDPNFFITEPFAAEKADRRFSVRGMVAL